MQNTETIKQICEKYGVNYKSIYPSLKSRGLDVNEENIKALALDRDTRKHRPSSSLNPYCINIRAVCKKYNVPYTSVKTYFQYNNILYTEENIKMYAEQRKPRPKKINKNTDIDKMLVYFNSNGIKLTEDNIRKYTQYIHNLEKFEEYKQKYEEEQTKLLNEMILKGNEE